MVFFLKKGQMAEIPKESPSDKVVAFTIGSPLANTNPTTNVQSVKSGQAMHSIPRDSAPSAEGLAIARRLSGERTAIPAGFIVKTDHFHLYGQSSLSGRLEGELYGAGKVEIGATGSFYGNAICDELAVCGAFEGDGIIDKFVVKAGAQCRGRIRGNSFSLFEGGIFDGEYSRRES